jgi:hypothetical protein
MPRKTAAAGSLYSPHPGIEYARSVLANFERTTGKSVEEWVELLQTAGPADAKARREWLKAEHGVGTNMAWWIAERAEGRGLEDTDPELYLKAAPGYVEAMYAGGKAGLRPLHDRLVALGRSLGPDVKVCPCQTIVPLYRNHVFAQIKPATRTRIDFGLALGDTKATGRLIDTGGFAKKDRITHRIPVTKPADIDAEVRKWLKVAYDRDA